MGLEAGGRGGGKVKASKKKGATPWAQYMPKQQKKQSAMKNPITKNLLGAIRSPKHPANKGTTTVIKKKYAPTPDQRKSSGSSSYSSGSSTPSERRPVGTSGGRTGAKNTTRKGAPNANRGNGEGRGGSKSGGGGASRPGAKSYMKQARQYVNRDLRAQLDSLRNEVQDRRKDFRWDQAQADSRYDRATGDLNHIFGEADEQNRLQTQAILDRITGQTGATNQMFDQLGAAQQGNTSQNTQALLGELQRLGIQGGANLAPMQADAAWAQNMGEQGRTNTLANLGAMGQSAGDIGNLISQMARSSQASNLGKQLNLKNQTIAESQHNFMGERDEIRDAMRQERLQKGNRIMDLYRDLEEQGYNRWFQEREANRANRLGWSNFNHGVSMDNAGLMMDKAQMLQEQRAAAAQRRAMENQLRALNGGGGGGAQSRFNPLGGMLNNWFPGLGG